MGNGLDDLVVRGVGSEEEGRAMQARRLTMRKIQEVLRLLVVCGQATASAGAGAGGRRIRIGCRCQ